MDDASANDPSTGVDARQPVVSVVIDPIGWLPRTLSTVAQHVRQALDGVPGEIVVAIGSDVHDEAQEAECREAGARVVSFDAEHLRAAALNNGVAAAAGEFVLVLDEDFVLADGAIAAALRRMEDAQADIVQLERRDGHASPDVTIHGLERISDRRYLESAPRARTNRGTAVLLRRRDMMRVRGFDERPSLRPHLSLDLLARLGRTGLVLEWLDGPDVAAYHFFGTTCIDVHDHGVQSKRVREAHHDAVGGDRSVYRNLTSWSVPADRRDVLISVAVSTRDRSDYLEECIDSVLAQTFPDFELIVVDDGSSDRTREVVEGYADPRVRYIRQDPAGISAARNLAAEHSRGFFTAVHDDDDLMLPWRLEASLMAIDDEFRATYGSWVNFDDVSGKMVLHVTRDGFSSELNAFNGQGPGHATWLLPTEAIRAARYDEHLSSSVDHNLASRLAWSGLRWRHTGRVMYLRRIHPTQVSAVDGGRQRTTWVLTRFANTLATSEPGRALMVEQGGALPHPEIPEKANLFAAFGAYLPDHLVERTLVLTNNVTNKVIDLDLYQKVGVMLAESDRRTGRLRLEQGELPGLSWKDLVTLRASGVVGVRIEARRREPEPESPAAHAADIMEIAPDSDADRARTLVMERLAQHFSVLRKKSPTSLWLIATVGALQAEELLVLDEALYAYDIHASGDHGTRFGVHAFGFERAAGAMAALARLEDAAETGRLLIADAEQQPGGHTGRMLLDALSGREESA